MEVEKRLAWIFFRYLVILVSALGSLFIFYSVFTPLTIYPVYLLLSLLYQVILSGNSLFIGGAKIVLIDACIAGAAYYLLFLLNMATPMKLKTRIYSLIFAFGLFLIVNVLRIFLFSVMVLNSFEYFDLTHLLFWYFLSSIIVFLIWIWTVKLFNVDEIPFWSDLKYIYSLTKSKRPKQTPRKAKKRR